MTPLPNGNWEITSQNVYEIAIMKAERDYYRDLVEKMSNRPLAIGVGVGTLKGAYAEIQYRLEL